MSTPEHVDSALDKTQLRMLVGYSTARIEHVTFEGKLEPLVMLTARSVAITEFDAWQERQQPAELETEVPLLIPPNVTKKLASMLAATALVLPEQPSNLDVPPAGE